MNPDQEFIQFALKHPEYYHIATSKIFLQILQFLCSGAKSLQEVYPKFDKIEPEDIEQMLETLVSIGLAKKLFVASGTIYFTTSNGKMLLKKVKKAKKHLFL